VVLSQASAEDGCVASGGLVTMSGTVCRRHRRAVALCAPSGIAIALGAPAEQYRRPVHGVALGFIRFFTVFYLTDARGVPRPPHVDAVRRRAGLWRRESPAMRDLGNTDPASPAVTPGRGQHLRRLYADLPRHTAIARTRQARAATSGARDRAGSANKNKPPNARRRMP
jgi:hypothetical protein